MYVSNRYFAASACKLCEGVVRHEPWCARENSNTAYAWAIVQNPELIGYGDALALHALGVVWGERVCGGSCAKSS